MDFNFAEEDSAVAELARKILEDSTTNDRLKDIESRDVVFDADLWKSLADSNLLGTAIPEAQGGMQMGFFALGLLMYEVGRCVAPIPAYASLVLGGLPLARFGSDAEKAEWLPRVATGEVILSAALTEIDSSDPMRPATRATRSDGGFVLSGEKSLVPAATLADRILIPATTAEGNIILAWVMTGAAGLSIEAQLSSDRQPHGFVHLDAVAVPEADCLGGTEDGAVRLAWLIEHATAARAMTQLGVTERALEMTADYGRERVQFDRPIGSFQAFHTRAADAYIMVEALRLTAWEAAWRLSKGLDASEHVSVAKYWAAEGGQFASFACQHLHGGIGIDVDYPLHRYFIWATQIEHELGAAPHQLEKLGELIATEGMPEF
jgi:alkylation response protein AidB-like acyl-CoA dehydrogenase